MHGPTSMGNRLACALAVANLDILTENYWQDQVEEIKRQLAAALLPLCSAAQVVDVRILGAIGVVKTYRSVNMVAVQQWHLDSSLRQANLSHASVCDKPRIVTVLDRCC